VGSFPWPNDIVSLHYADDTFLLVLGDVISLISLKLILCEFEMITGLKINFNKSYIYNLSRCKEVGMRAAAILNCNLSSLSFTYLGLLIKATSLTKEDWQPLIERVEQRLVTWKGNALSRGGRFIPVNSVLFSIPLYFMSLYYLPEWVIYAIDHIRRAFFWKGARNIHGGFCLINWQLVCSHNLDWGFAIYGLSTSLFYPIGGGNFFS